MQFLRALRTSSTIKTFLSFLVLAGASFAAPPDLWYFHHSYITSTGAVQQSEALIDRAQSAGYTGVVFWDSSFSFIGAPFWPAENVHYLEQVLNYAAAKGLKILVTVAPFGYSNDALQNNPNLAESQRVVGTQFRVSAKGDALTLVDSFPGLSNGGFEAGQSDWFDLNDSGVLLDPGVGHTGHSSARLSDGSGNTRIRQLMDVKPWRQYHLRLWFKSSALNSSPSLYLFDADNFNSRRLNLTINASGTHDWTAADFTFNSQSSTRLFLYTGIWGSFRGTLWFDDLSMEETALIYLTRRPGTPFVMYDSGNPNKTFREWTDYTYVYDPQMNNRNPWQDQYHAPPVIKLPSTTTLKPNQIVSVDSYAVDPLPVNQVGMCLSEAAVWQWMQKNAEAVNAILPPGAGWFLQYDEMRQMNSCGACRSKGMTAGQLLAWHVQRSAELYRAVRPDAPQYIWSDMFDPAHNAVNDYYDVEGALAGSWTALTPEMTVVNWNLNALPQSLTWFAGKNAAQPVKHPQIIAGYYDSGNGAQAAQTELSAAGGIPGLTGLLYTTWNDDYSQLESFAAAVRQKWPQYEASVAPSFQPIRVNCGGRQLTTADGLVWQADTGATTGNIYATYTTIANTADSPLYQTERWNAGTLTYTFAVPNGRYNVRLKFAENYFAALGKRVFNIALNGNTVRQSLDIFVAAGGAFRALDLVYPVTIADGKVIVELKPLVENPKIDAIEITAAALPTP